MQFFSVKAVLNVHLNITLREKKKHDTKFKLKRLCGVQVVLDGGVGSGKVCRSGLVGGVARLEQVNTRHLN